MLSTLLSSFAIFMEAAYGFDALRVGFSFMAMGVVMMLTNVWFVPFLQKRMATTSLCALGFILNGGGLAIFVCTRNMWLALALFTIASVGTGLRSATNSAVVAVYTTTLNRGKIFGRVQMYQNFGRMVGPICATHMAGHNPSLPFMVCGAFGAGAALLTLIAPKPREESPPVLEKRPTLFGEEWQDEEGSDKDVEALGRFVADLLKRRHYKWVSRRVQIEQLLETLLPELETRDKCAYEASLADITERLFESSMQTDMVR